MHDSQISVDDLAALIKQTGEAHHAAYAASDGVDPEWAMWYAAHFQTLVGDQLGRALTRSEIVYLLSLAQKRADETGSSTPWPLFYAEVFLAEVTGPQS